MSARGYCDDPEHDDVDELRAEVERLRVERHSSRVEAKVETVLVLRVCNPDRSSYSDTANGFEWPESGPVEAPDWRPTVECGQGLHGFLWGAGDVGGSGAGWAFTNTDRARNAKWLVVEVAKSDIIELDGGTKVKFPRGNVIFCGALVDAAKIICDRAPAGVPVIGGCIKAGHGGTATAGDYGTATAGDHGTATAGDGGTATAGDHGTATAGYGGTATAGDYGTATAGDGGTATAGENGSIQIQYWDPKRCKYRIAAAEVGENGIEPNTAYILDVSADGARFVKKPK